MDTVGLYLGFFLRFPAVWATAAIATAVISSVLILVSRPRTPDRLLIAIAAAGSIALIVAFTWLPSGGDLAEPPGPWSLSRVMTMFSRPAGFGAISNGTDGPLNVLLYVPAGVTVPLCIRRLRLGWLAVPALAVLSLTTEVGQALTGTRAGSLEDVAANTAGALLGTAASLVIRSAARHLLRRSHRSAPGEAAVSSATGPPGRRSG